MPRTPVDYSKTIIYKLVKNDDYDNANVYVGSTTDFTRRKRLHKSSCNNDKNKEYDVKKYQYIRANGGWNEWGMVLIEKFPCNDGNEARAHEEYWRCHFNSQLNTRRAYIPEEQRKEQRKEIDKKHYENNKNKILEKQSQQITCECGCILSKCCLARHRKTQNHLLLTKQIKYEFVDDNGEN
jgi:hypothetical protein